MPTIAEKFRIKGSAPVSLRIDIGSAQIGGYSMLLESTELQPKSADGEHAQYDLGSGDDVRFTVLIGTVEVKDVNPTTDQTTVTTTVTQGLNRRVFQDHAQAPTGGEVRYGVAISFV